MCVLTQTHINADVYTNTCVWSVSHHSANHRASFLSLTSKLSVSSSTNEAELNLLSISPVFTQPVFPECPLCAEPYGRDWGGRHKLGLSPASQGHHIQVRGGPPASGGLSSLLPRASLGECRRKAGSKFLSGDNVRASGGQAACLILGTHRTLGFPAGLRSARVPSGDSGCLWQGLGPLPDMLTAKAAAQPSGVSHQAGHTRNACLPAVPPVCWLAFVHAASKKVHGTSLPDARPLFQPCHALHCGLHGLLPGNEGPDLLLYVYYPSAMPGQAPHLRAESQTNNLLARTGWLGDPKGPYL